MRVLLTVIVVVATTLQCHVASAATSTGDVPPMLPTQFRADVTIMSHLTDPRQRYPPSVRRMRVQYDLQQQLAKAEMLEGYETNKTYVRRYDQKREYMVKHGGVFEKCERAYLGEHALKSLSRLNAMGQTRHLTPFLCAIAGIESVKGIACEHWIHSYANVRVHIYSDVKTHGTSANSMTFGTLGFL
ncbi:hypothetical protein FI667_g1925, partial [Globisporangium splendens]